MSNAEAQSPGRFSHLKEEASKLSDKAREELQKLKEKASVYKEGATEFLDAASTYVKENPQRSMVIAGVAGIGLGVIIGLLLRGRRD